MSANVQKARSIERVMDVLPSWLRPLYIVPSYYDSGIVQWMVRAPGALVMRKGAGLVADCTVTGEAPTVEDAILNLYEKLSGMTVYNEPLSKVTPETQSFQFPIVMRLS